MGFEYRANLNPPLADAARDRLAERLRHDPSWELVGSGANLAFRLSGRPLREKWPEDFRVVLEPAGVYVLFHSGLAEREAFPRIEEALKSEGVAANFEEL